MHVQMCVWGYVTAYSDVTFTGSVRTFKTRFHDKRESEVKVEVKVRSTMGKTWGINESPQKDRNIYVCLRVLVMGISSFSSSTCRWNFVCLCLEHELFTPSFYFSFIWSEVDILAPALAAFSFFYQAIRALLFISSSSSTHTATRHEGKIGFLLHSDNLQRHL